MTSLSVPPGVTLANLTRMTAAEVLTTYGPEVSALVARLQGSGIVPFRRSDYDEAITRQVRLEIIAREGDCRCGKIDCWKREMGID